MKTLFFIQRMPMEPQQLDCVQCVVQKMPMVQHVNVQRDNFGFLLMETTVFAEHVLTQMGMGLDCHLKQNATNVQSDIIMLPKVAMTETDYANSAPQVKLKIPLPTEMDAGV